ncbi:hypothetical protein C8F01DRAFT_1348554 [Mycena amicta]|nr:hypothetical protein C8F01DRAFT_1348554 [Mycena amicta]
MFDFELRHQQSRVRDPAFPPRTGGTPRKEHSHILILRLGTETRHKAQLHSSYGPDSDAARHAMQLSSPKHNNTTLIIFIGNNSTNSAANTLAGPNSDSDSDSAPSRRPTWRTDRAKRRQGRVGTDPEPPSSHPQIPHGPLPTLRPSVFFLPSANFGRGVHADCRLSSPAGSGACARAPEIKFKTAFCKTPLKLNDVRHSSTSPAPLVRINNTTGSQIEDAAPSTSRIWIPYRQDVVSQWVPKPQHACWLDLWIRSISEVPSFLFASSRETFISTPPEYLQNEMWWRNGRTRVTSDRSWIDDGWQWLEAGSRPSITSSADLYVHRRIWFRGSKYAIDRSANTLANCFSRTRTFGEQRLGSQGDRGNGNRRAHYVGINDGGIDTWHVLQRQGSREELQLNDTISSAENFTRPELQAHHMRCLEATPGVIRRLQPTAVTKEVSDLKRSGSALDKQIGFDCFGADLNPQPFASPQTHRNQQETPRQWRHHTIPCGDQLSITMRKSRLRVEPKPRATTRSLGHRRCDAQLATACERSSEIAFAWVANKRALTADVSPDKKRVAQITECIYIDKRRGSKFAFAFTFTHSPTRQIRSLGHRRQAAVGDYGSL